MPEGNVVARIMGQLGLDFNPAITAADLFVTKIKTVDTILKELQATAIRTGSILGQSFNAVGMSASSMSAQQIKDAQMLAYTSRATAQSRLADARSAQAENAPLLQQAKQRISLANEELILTRAKGRYLIDSSEAGKRRAATELVNARMAVEAAREAAVIEKSRTATSVVSSRVATEAAREAAVAEKARGQALRDSAVATRVNAQATTEAARQSALLAQARRNEAQAALAAARANQIATGAVTTNAAAHRGLYNSLYNTGTMIHHLNWLASGVILFAGLGTAKQGLVDYEKHLANITTTLPQLHGNIQATNAAGQELLKTSERYGVSLEEIANSARSVSRLYKETATALGMVDQITLLNVIDNVNLDNATKGLEATMVSYGKGLKNNAEILSFSMDIIDRITTLTHNAFAKGDDLVQILQRSASAAKVAGMQLSELLALGTTALRSTGLPGANIGNFLKTIIGTLAAPTDKVKASLKEIGVELKNTEGKLRPVYDILLDISKATGKAQYSQEDLTGAIEATSRGIFQWAKLAAVIGNYEEIVRTSALQFQAQGQTMAMAGQQLDTLARKASTLKAAMIDLFANAGNSGIRNDLKATIDSITQFILGLKSSGSTLLKIGGLYLGFGLLLKTMTGIYNMLSTAVGILTAAKVRLTVATEVQTVALTAETGVAARAAAATTAFTAALARNPIGLLTVGVAALIGYLVNYTYATGEAEKATIDLSQKRQDDIQAQLQQINRNKEHTDWLKTMAKESETLKKAIDSGTLSDAEKAAAQSKLDAVTQAVTSTLSDQEKQIVANSKTMSEAIKKINEKREALNAEKITTINNQIEETKAVQEGAIARMTAYDNEVKSLEALANARGASLVEKAKETSPGKYAVNYAREAFGRYNPAAVFGLPGARPSDTTTPISELAAKDTLQPYVQGNKSEYEKAAEDAKKAKNDIQGYIDSIKALGNTLTVPHAGDAGGDDDDKPPNLSDFAAPMKEMANEAKLAMTQYQDALQSTDLQLTNITARERIFRLQLKNDTVPTMNQVIQEQSLYTETIQANLVKQNQLHAAANEGRAQLAELSATMADLIQQHESGAISTKEFNAAMSSLNPTIQQLEKDVAGYGNSWMDAEYNIKETQQTLADMKDEYSKKVFDNATKVMNHEVTMARMSTQQQIAYLKELETARQWDTATQWKLQEERIQAYKKGLKEQMDLVKEAYDTRLKQIEDEIDAEDGKTKKLVDNKEKEIKAIDKETDVQIKAIQTLMDALDTEQTNSDREEAERDHNQKIADLQKEKQYHEVRTGFEHQNKIDEINKEMAEEEHAWDLKKKDWARDDQKDTYQDQIDALKEQEDARKDAINQEITDIKKASDTKKKELQKYYDQIQKLLSDKNLDMLASLSTTDEQWYNKAVTWMEKLAQGIRDGSINVTDAMSGLQSLIDSGTTTSQNRPTVKPSTGTSGTGSSGSTSGSITQKVPLATIGPGQYTMEGDTAYMWSRSLANLLGKSVQWNEQYQQVKIGSEWFNPIMKGDNAYVGIRQVAESLGYKVGWNDPNVLIYPQAHTGASVGDSGIAELLKGERVLSPQLTVSFDRMAQVLANFPSIPDRIATMGQGGGFSDNAVDRIVAAIESRKGVQIGTLFHAENVGFEDQGDMDIFNRQLAQKINSLSTARGR